MLTTSKATLMRLTAAGDAPTIYTWEPARTIWVRNEQNTKTNLFSKVGVGARGAIFYIYRPGDLTMHDALIWRNEHNFITSIIQKSPVEAEVAAAIVDIVQCYAERKDSLGRDEYNRPKPEIIPIASFPGILTEKYLGWEQQQPQAATQKVMVLVTPKPVTLRVGDLVTVGDDKYNVQIVHDLDEYKNEYEIAVRGDA